MNSNFEFRKDEDSFKKLISAIQPYPKTCNLMRLAVSLGAVIAGGAAIALFEGPANRGKYMSVRDVDVWFPNQDILDTFMATVKLMDGVTFKKSFGGHAYDINTREYGPTLQVIAFRVGDPIEIISQFDFTNCAVALNEKGFWYHKDVPELLDSKKLRIQNDNSPFFASRVHKYLQKGFHTLDDCVQDRLFQELDTVADRGIEIAKSFKNAESATSKPLKEFDAEYKPMMMAAQKAESALIRFLNFEFRYRSTSEGIRTPVDVFKPEQRDRLDAKMKEIQDLLKSVKAVRIKMYDLPYGYAKGASDSSEPDLDAILNLV